MAPTAYSPRWYAEEKPHIRCCDVEGCDAPGEHRAPKSRASTQSQDYYWFCLNHVTQYNKSWNYFDGMSEMEMEFYFRDAAYQHRPTWKRDGKQFTAEHLSEAVRRRFADYLSKGEMPDDPQQRIMPIDRRVKDALAVLDLGWPVTLQEVKAQFKILVKKYHPDINDSKEAEARFRHVNDAYQLLKESLADQKPDDKSS